MITDLIIIQEQGYDLASKQWSHWPGLPAPPSCPHSPPTKDPVPGSKGDPRCPERWTNRILEKWFLMFWLICALILHIFLLDSQKLSVRIYFLTGHRMCQDSGWEGTERFVECLWIMVVDRTCFKFSSLGSTDVLLSSSVCPMSCIWMQPEEMLFSFHSATFPNVPASISDTVQCLVLISNQTSLVHSL